MILAGEVRMWVVVIARRMQLLGLGPPRANAAHCLRSSSASADRPLARPVAATKLTLTTCRAGRNAGRRSSEAAAQTVDCRP